MHLFKDKKPFIDKLSIVILFLTFTTPIDTMASDLKLKKSKKIDKETNVIVITGIRGALKENLNNKRYSNNIVDSIDSSDVAKNPDKNVAEALQRISGVQLVREFGEGLSVSIRGTSPDFTNTLINGQSLSSAEWRPLADENNATDFSGVSAQQISKITVYKSPQADLIAGGIGGTVLLETRTPLEMSNNKAYLNLDFQYHEGSKQSSPQLATQWSWKNTEETFGALMNLSYSELNVQRDGNEVISGWRNFYDPGQTLGGRVLNPFWLNQTRFSQNRERKNVNLSIETQPFESFNIIANFTGSFSDMGNKSESLLLNTTKGFKSIYRQPSEWVAQQFDVLNAQGSSLGMYNRHLVSARYNALQLRNSSGSREQNIWQQTIDRAGTTVDNKTFNIKLDYQSNWFRLSGDVGRSRANSHKTNFMNGFHLNNDPQYDGLLQSNTIYYENHSQLSFYNKSKLFTQPTKEFAQNEFWRDFIDIQNTNDFVKTDLRYDFNGSLSIKAGLYFENKERSRYKAIDRSNAVWYNFIYGNNFKQGATVDRYINGTLERLNEKTGSRPQTFFTLDMDKALSDFNQLSIIANLDTCSTKTLCRTGYQQTGTSYNLETDKYSGYLMLNFESDWVRGNIGARYIDSSSTRKNRLANGLQAKEQKGGYSHLIPSLNLVYDFSQDWLLRLALSKAISPPTFSKTISELEITSLGVQQRAKQGNPNLKPFSAKQFETGISWYFSDVSLFSLTYFGKNIKNWIVDYSRPIFLSLDGKPSLFLLDMPFNAQGMQQLRGAEIQLQHDFNNGFGFVANYTYIDVPSLTTRYLDYKNEGNDEILAENLKPVWKEKKVRMKGNSRHSGNLQFYFENDQYSARLAYNYRSNFVVDENQIREMVQMKKGNKRFDFKSTYSYTENLSFALSIINLTNELSRRYLLADSNSFDTQYLGNYHHRVYENGRRYFLGAYYTF
jgi:iron complex outermembrane receptor protein